MRENQSDSFWSMSGATEPLPDQWRDISLLHASGKGWCNVYTCTHRGRKIVLKALKEQYRDSPLHKDLLNKEYTICSGMLNSHIAAAYGFETVAGVGECIVMEYVDGMTLPQYLAQRGPLTKEEIRRLIEQICNAVSYIHSHQIVHCDLKPSNILITRHESYVKIIDFGLARGFGYEQLDFCGGTQGFTAPENLKDGIKAHPAMDVYSIGRIIEYLDDKHRYKSIVAQCCAAEPKRRIERVELIPQWMHRIEQRKTLVFGGVVGCLIVLTGLLAIYSKNENKAVQEQVAEVDVITRDTVDVLVPDTLSVSHVESQVTTPYAPPMEQRKTAVSDVLVAVDSSARLSEDSTEFLTPNTYVPFEEQLYQVALQCAEKRFKEHMTLIDTMTTQYSNQLVAVKHWRWLAKQDVRKWLEGFLSANNPRMQTLMDDAESAIIAYGDDGNREAEEYKRKVAAIRRVPELNGVTTKYSYYIDDDRICTRTFGEDGQWTTEVKSLTPRP